MNKREVSHSESIQVSILKLLSNILLHWHAFFLVNSREKQKNNQNKLQIKESTPTVEITENKEAHKAAADLLSTIQPPVYTSKRTAVSYDLPLLAAWRRWSQIFISPQQLIDWHFSDSPAVEAGVCWGHLVEVSASSCVSDPNDN